MTRKPLTLGTNLLAAVLAGGALMAGAPAMAQQVSEITVVAPHAVHQRTSSTPSGVAVEVVSLTRRVGYGDLDLATPSGVAAFTARIAETAKQACSQLDTLYPDSRYPADPANQDCVKTAIDHGLAQATIVIASAGK
jgi:UrcA family protein